MYEGLVVKYGVGREGVVLQWGGAHPSRIRCSATHSPRQIAAPNASSLPLGRHPTDAFAEVGERQLLVESDPLSASLLCCSAAMLARQRCTAGAHRQTRQTRHIKILCASVLAEWLLAADAPSSARKNCARDDLAVFDLGFYD